MSIKQLSIFLENKSGRLTEVLETLGQEKIRIAALSIADTSEYGILRIIVSKPDDALQLLKARNFSVNQTDVIGIETPVEAGSFADVLKSFSEESIGIEYMYAFLGRNSGHSPAVLRVEDTEKAIKLLEESNIKLLNESEL